MLNPKIHRVPLGKMNSARPENLTLILTPSPNRVKSQKKEGKREKRKSRFGLSRR